MKQSNNVVTHGMSGKINLLVFRQRYGETVISKTPRRRDIPPTAAQALIRATFKQAAVYAKAILTDLAVKAAYKAKAKLGQSPFNVALADFFKPPAIGEINLGGYDGQPGSLIRAQVTDDFMVTAVFARIEGANGALIEDGAATISADGLHWDYTASATNGSMGNSTVIITATDLPGHSIVKSKTT